MSTPKPERGACPVGSGPGSRPATHTITRPKGHAHRGTEDMSILSSPGPAPRTCQGPSHVTQPRSTPPSSRRDMPTLRGHEWAQQHHVHSKARAEDMSSQARPRTQRHPRPPGRRTCPFFAPRLGTIPSCPRQGPSGGMSSARSSEPRAPRPPYASERCAMVAVARRWASAARRGRCRRGSSSGGATGCSAVPSGRWPAATSRRCRPSRARRANRRLPARPGRRTGWRTAAGRRAASPRGSRR